MRHCGIEQREEGGQNALGGLGGEQIGRVGQIDDVAGGAPTHIVSSVGPRGGFPDRGFPDRELEVDLRCRRCEVDDVDTVG
ncbi:hypothetical protein GCM10027169_24220 [Gordonia jinhuaensis]